jgi:hypothetical protein
VYARACARGTGRGQGGQLNPRVNLAQVIDAGALGWKAGLAKADEPDPALTAALDAIGREGRLRYARLPAMGGAVTTCPLPSERAQIYMRS